MAEEKKSVFQWQQMIELIVVMMTILGSTIPLFIQTDNKLESNRQETNALIKSIQADIRDFHVRLEKIDAEYKSHIIYEHCKK